MTAAGIVTIVLALLTVLVLAAYLIGIAAVLGRVNSKLRQVTKDLHVVAEKTEPAGAIVQEMNKDLAGVEDTARSMLPK